MPSGRFTQENCDKHAEILHRYPLNGWMSAVTYKVWLYKDTKLTDNYYIPFKEGKTKIILVQDFNHLPLTCRILHYLLYP